MPSTCEDDDKPISVLESELDEQKDLVRSLRSAGDTPDDALAAEVDVMVSMGMRLRQKLRGGDAGTTEEDRQELTEELWLEDESGPGGGADLSSLTVAGLLCAAAEEGKIDAVREIGEEELMAPHCWPCTVRPP